MEYLLKKYPCYLKYLRFFIGLSSLFFLSTIDAAIPPAPASFQMQGFQANVYAGVADLTTNFGSQYYSPNYFGTPPNTLGGSTDSAEFAPGFGISYVLPTTSYTAIKDSYLLHDVTLGIKAYYLNGQRTGPVYSFGIHSISSDNYSMSLYSWRVMLDSQFDFHPIVNGWVMPFLEAGIGDAINTMNYNETATVPGAYTLNLESHTTQNFAYDLGFGAKVPLTPRANLSLSYLYSNLQTAEATTPIAASTKDISSPLVAHMHASSFLLGFNYALTTPTAASE